jgi:hypothetical protein
VAALDKVPDPVVMIPRQMKTGEAAPAGVPVISVPAYNIQRGPAPGQLFHPRDRGQGYLLTLGDKLVYVAGDTECVPAMDVMALGRMAVVVDAGGAVKRGLGTLVELAVRARKLIIVTNDAHCVTLSVWAHRKNLSRNTPCCFRT